MDLTEQTVEKRYVYRGRIIKVRNDPARLPDGNPCQREVVEHTGGVAIIAEYQGKIALVRQYRYPYAEPILEIPAGKLNPGEDPLACGKRELEEETGLTAKRWIDLGMIYPSPGYTDEKLYLYRAEELAEGNRHPDDDEFLDVVWMTPSELDAAVRSGEIKDAKTVIAYFRSYR